MLMDKEGQSLWQRHPVRASEHGSERLPAGTPAGAGVLLYFQVNEVRALHARAMTIARLAGHTEFVLHDPDSYAVATYQRGEV